MGRGRKRKKRSRRSSRRVKWLEDDIVVWSDRKAKTCWECGGAFKGGRSLVVFQGKKKRSKPTCIQCMGLEALAFLPAGSSKLTRRASKYSSMRAVVVRHRRKYVERFGVLVEPEALFRACDECEVPVPEGCQGAIAGTNTALPPRVVLASRDEEYRAATPQTRQVTADRNDKIATRSKKLVQPGSAKAKPTAADISRLSSLIREAFPGCSSKRARRIAKFGLERGEFDLVPVKDLSSADVGPLVSKYLRRHRRQEPSRAL